MKKRFCPVGLSLAALLLEGLPWGVRMQFMAPPGQAPFVEMTSYFDLTPFGYANFSPLVTALLTCVLALLTALYAVQENARWLRPAKYIAPVAAVASVCPVLVGAYTLVGGLISVLLLGQALCLFRLQK